MKIPHSSLVFVLLAVSLGALAQTPATAPPPPHPAAKQPDHADAYYHFELGHIDEDMAAVTGSNDYATQAIDEYKAALKADPNSSYLATELADLYARTGDIRQAVAEAQEVISRDPNNLDARRLLGHIYLRSIGDLQGSTQSDSEAVLHLAIEQYEQIVRLAPTSLEDHLLLGRLYRLNGETGKAEAEFHTAVQLQPASEDAVTTLALMYNEEGDAGRALNILLSVPEGQRTSRIDSVLGYSYEQKKDYPHAIEAYRKAVELDGDDLDAKRGLAENLLNDNQFAAAMELYKKIVAADPQDAQTLLHMAEIYRHDGQFDHALEALNQAKTIAPDSMEIEYNRAAVEETIGKFDDATRQLQGLVERTARADGHYSESERSNRAIFLERLGTVYRDQSKTQPAVDTFRQMLTLGGDAAVRGYQQLVESYRDAKDWPAAMNTAREAAAKYPKDSGLQITLAGEEADSGQANAGLARVKALLKGKASDREVWIALAQMNSRLRRYSDAQKALGKALALSTKPDDVEYINFIQGSIYERQKKYSQAEEYFRKVLANDPLSATTLNYLGYMLADRGTRLDEALALIRRAVALDPQNGAYLDSLGWVQFKMGKYDMAEAALRKAVARMDNDPTVHEHLGDVYQKTNRLQLAVTQWERSLEEWKTSLPAEVEAADVAKVQKKLDQAKVKLAKQDESGAK